MSRRAAAEKMVDVVVMKKGETDVAIIVYPELDLDRTRPRELYIPKSMATVKSVDEEGFAVISMPQQFAERNRIPCSTPATN